MKRDYLRLSKRERQIMDVLYKRGKATAAEVHGAIADPPSYSAVRATLRILEEKAHVRHEQDGPRYVFFPAVTRERAKRAALRHVLETFFDGSAELAVATLLDESASRLDDAEYERMKALIDEAKRKGGRR